MSCHYRNCKRKKTKETWPGQDSKVCFPDTNCTLLPTEQWGNMLGARKMWKGVLYTSDIGELSGYYAKFCSLNLVARASFPQM